MQENKLNSTPLVSIILPVYNGEKFLAQSIESCLNQTYKNIELIIVNDCSTDNSFNIANKFAELDGRVKIITNKENKKLPASLNFGHEIANGDLITWTSDDNVFELNAIEVLSEKLLQKNVDIVYSDIIIIDHNGKKVREVTFPDFENVLFRNYIGSCFLYKKEVFEKNKGYNENLFLVEDYDFWLRAIAHSRFYQVREKLYNYRKHDSSLTHQIANNNEKKLLFNKNVTKMYSDFTKEILDTDHSRITEFLAKALTYQNIPFEWIIVNERIINQFKKKLFHNINFQDKNVIEKIFLDKTIHLMVLDKGVKTNLYKSFYIIRKYGLFLDKKAVKTLIKYSFFKKK